MANEDPEDGSHLGSSNMSTIFGNAADLSKSNVGEESLSFALTGSRIFVSCIVKKGHTRENWQISYICIGIQSISIGISISIYAK